jgi:hypothetical protein
MIENSEGRRQKAQDLDCQVDVQKAKDDFL